MSRNLIAALSLSAALAACTEPVKSGEVYTDEIDATFTVMCDGELSTISATLILEGGYPLTYVELEGDDSLTATAGGQSKELNTVTIGDSIVYTAALPVTEADEPFVLALERSIDGGAPDTTVSLPAPFSISSPQEGASFSRSGEELVINWDLANDGDTMTVTVEGDCIEDWSESLSEDPGSLTIGAGELVALDGQEAETCDLTVGVSRMREGELDPAYAGGLIHAMQVRAVTLTAAP